MASLNETSKLNEASVSSTTCRVPFELLSAPQLRHLENAICRYLREDGTAGCLDLAVFGVEGDRTIGGMMEEALQAGDSGDFIGEVIWITRVRNDLLQPNLYQFFSTMIETMTFPLPGVLKLFA